MKRTIQEELLEQYRDFLHFKASEYKGAGFEYDEVFNQGYLYLLENYQNIPSSIDLRRKVDSELRKYYRHEAKERHISHGTNPKYVY